MTPLPRKLNSKTLTGRENFRKLNSKSLPGRGHSRKLDSQPVRGRGNLRRLNAMTLTGHENSRELHSMQVRGRDSCTKLNSTSLSDREDSRRFRKLSIRGNLEVAMELCRLVLGVTAHSEELSEATVRTKKTVRGSALDSTELCEPPLMNCTWCYPKSIMDTIGFTRVPID